MHAATGRVSSVAPLKVEAPLEFASEQGLDPNAGPELPLLVRLGRKYKRCCA
jgi:hypothetical protein